jgi:hypothetical protein
LIYSRIKLYYNLRTDAELAVFLGITAQAISNSIARNSPNWNNIITKCEDVDLNWLLGNSNEMLRNHNQNGNIVENSRVVGTSVNGNGIQHVDGGSSKLMDIIEEQQKQIGKLIEVINKLSNK